MWTPTALVSEFRCYRRTVWRVVEAQHRISTNRLADNIEDQARLEELAEEAKPDLPKSAQGLHYLLASPFRYGHKSPSRFRRANVRPGIFYASENESTAIAETAYWRLRFFSRSPNFVPGNRTSEHLSFSVAVSTSRAVDLSRPPFDAQAPDWTQPYDYQPCQDIADAARQADTQLIRTVSARDPDAGYNAAIFDPAVFAGKTPHYRQTWHFRFEQGRLNAIAAFPGGRSYAFEPEIFGLPRSSEH
jgi:RES domain